MRVAVVKMSAIGDVVETLPVVQSLRAAIPDLHLTWTIQPVPYQLVKNVRAVDEFLFFDRAAGLRGYREIFRATRGRSWDLVLDLQVALKAGIVTAMLRAPRKLGFDWARSSDLHTLFVNERIPARAPRHRQDQYLEFVEYLGVPPRLEWGLGTVADERARYAGLLPPDPSPSVALVLASSQQEKNWPVERYGELAIRLQRDLGARVVLVGGLSGAESQGAAAIQRAAPAPFLDLRAWDLRRLVYLLERVEVVVAPDTGPMHIAVALGTPTVGLMGYTNPARGGPYRFRELTVDAYHDSGEVPSAAGAYRRGRMQRITVEQVMERVELALARYPRREEPEPSRFDLSAGSP